MKVAVWHLGAEISGRELIAGAKLLPVARVSEMRDGVARFTGQRRRTEPTAPHKANAEEGNYILMAVSWLFGALTVVLGVAGQDLGESPTSDAL